MSTTELLALLSVKLHHMMTEKQRAACFTSLIPSGLVDAKGTWKLTERGEVTLIHARKTNPVIRDLYL